MAGDQLGLFDGVAVGRRGRRDAGREARAEADGWRSTCSAAAR